MTTTNAAPMDDAIAAYNKGDYKEALKIWRPLTDQENASAQFNLGVMYHNGQGVTQDYASAHMWWNLASSAGDADGAKNRDIIAKLMTPQQIEKAQDMARACEARNFKGC
jgi:TPR repeat protein